MARDCTAAAFDTMPDTGGRINVLLRTHALCMTIKAPNPTHGAEIYQQVVLYVLLLNSVSHCLHQTVYEILE